MSLSRSAQTLVMIAATFSVVKATAATLTVLHTFQGKDDGGFPQGGLTFGPNGLLYGVTRTTSSYGSIFSLDPATGLVTTIYAFTGPSGGWEPNTRLAVDKNGVLYGTTDKGAAGYGSVFRFDPASSQYTMLHPFTGNDDGGTPLGRLVLDSKGNLYGTTENGGKAGIGVVYEAKTSGKDFKVLHTFQGKDGFFPYSGVAMDAQGILYGTTFQGGGGVHNGGVIYSIDPANRAFTRLYSFTNKKRFGANPETTPVLDGEGNLFGTSSGELNAVVVYKFNLNTRQITKLWSLAEEPSTDLALDSQGTLFGATDNGGDDYGVFYSVHTDGKSRRILANFSNDTGTDPGAPIVGQSGDILDIATDSGDRAVGTAFEVTP